MCPTRTGTAGPIFTLYMYMARMTCWRAMTVLFRVKTMGDVIWEEYASKTPKLHEYATSGQNAESKTLNIPGAVNPIKSKFSLRNNLRPTITYRGWSTINTDQIQHDRRPPSWKTDMTVRCRWSDSEFRRKFGTLTQNDTQMTINGSKSEPET